MSTLWTLQRLYLLDTSSPDFLRNLHSLIRHDEKEQYLSTLQGPRLARLVDFLDKALGAIHTTDDIARECLNKLQTICGHHATLPSSCIVSGGIARVGDSPITLGSIVDVWEGTLYGKKVTIEGLRVHGGNYQAVKKSFFKEAVIWKRLRHPNIVPFIGVTIYPLQIISESMPNGTLTEFIARNPDASRIGLLLDVAEGLGYLHASNMIHGNLNGLNILVDLDGHAHLTTWAAPEILKGVGTITREADVFAFGMVVMEVFIGRPPSSGSSTPVISSMGERPVFPQEAQKLGLTDSIWDMTVRCWLQDPAQRPAMTEVIGLLQEVLVSSLSIEASLRDFLQVCKTRGKDGQGEKAQEFADRLDEGLESANLHEEKRKQYLAYLRWLCSTLDILPSSFMLSPKLIKRNATPFDSGGYSMVYKATFRDCPVVIKVLKTAKQTDQKLHRLLVKEVIGWKWLRHDNILPFVGVMFDASLISIASKHMDNGNIINFIKANRDYNRLDLLVGAVTGLKYLHEHNIVHGDLKGGNILIDSERRARLADFGLSTIADETIGRTTVADGGLKGTVRWMAPELSYPDDFGFTGKLRKQLPSKETDIYAIGMTILEVLTGCVPFANVNSNYTVTIQVRNGGRPEKPSSGLSDTLWELLVATWVVQYARESPGRPPACDILAKLKECVDHWRGSIVPLVPESWNDDGGDDDVPLDIMLYNPSGPEASSGHAPDVTEVRIPPLFWMLGIGIAISGGVLAVRWLFS